MSSCCTFRLNRRRALSMDSPSWIWISAINCHLFQTFHYHVSAPRRQVPFRRAVISDIFDVDDAEGAFAGRFLDRMRREADCARDNEESAAILPGNSHVGNEA